MTAPAVDTRRWPASEVYAVHLQAGRWLSGRALAVAVVLRNVPCASVGLGTGTVHPSWVVVTQVGDGTAVAKVPCGRVAGDAAIDLAQARDDLAQLTCEQFEARWVRRRRWWQRG